MSRERRFYRPALATLFLAGAALRVWGAWASRYITDLDCSVVALMARHLAAGREWPVFFYGQHYMGSLEPAVSALFVLLLGPTGFAVCLGPALVSIAALAVLYAWAKDAGGPRSGLATLALCVIGPFYYFMFQFAPRGGYMVALLASTFLLWKSGRLSVRSRTGREAPVREFFLFGLVAGLGLWSHAIILSAVLASAVVLLIGWRGAFWRKPGRVLAALTGALIGLAPWWIYNLIRGWPSLEMPVTAAAMPWRSGLRHAWLQWLRMVGLTDWPDGLRLGTAAGYLLLAGAGMAAAVRDALARRAWDRATAARLNALLFIGLSAALLIRSRFVTMNTARYLLPLVPALALLAGVAVAAAPRAWMRRAAAGLAFLLLITQFTVLAPLRELGKMVPERLAGQEALRAALEKEGARTIYAPLPAHHLNFNLGENFIFTDSRKVFYGPHYQAAEFSDTPAFLDNHLGIREFLPAGGGRARPAAAAGHLLHLEFLPPRVGLEPVPAAEREEITFNGDPAAELADLGLDTGREPDPGREIQTLEIRFRRPVQLRRLRLEFQPAWVLPAGFAVDLRDPGTGDWREALPEQRTTAFFWSGPRPFYDGRRQRTELQLAGEPADGVRVKLLDPDAARRVPGWRLVGVDVFQAGADLPPDEIAAFPELLRLLGEHGIRRLYADRWESNRIHLATGGEIAVELNQKLAIAGGLAPEGRVRGGERTAFLPRRPDARETELLLREAGWPAREFPVGPWTLLVCDGPLPEEAPPLTWTGYALRRERSARPAGPETAP